MTSKFATICKKCGGQGSMTIRIEWRLDDEKHGTGESTWLIDCGQCGEVEYL
ncbi:hypothetical protein LCGC14_2641660 [marine sediment metagenome]|uniref:Uncharacterized protein n=1 Tax=marine sediment metagenome TaxID=412755 RepID=A0A0F9C830_9ZZZZ